MKKPEEIPLNLTPRETAKLFLVSTVTIANWVKEGFLEMDGNHRITSESIRKFKKKYAGKAKLQSRANKSLKDGHDAKEVGDTIRKALLEKPFDDRLGDRYEAMLSESYKNKEGVFYTPMSIVGDMMQEVVADADSLFLDPCCGTGNFLLAALERGVAPQNLYGFDTDENAVQIARRRILERTGCEAPHVVCADFLQEGATMDVRFDLVFTNPPWGKKLSKAQRTEYARLYQAGSSSDTSSLFLFAILSVLKPDGQAGLLLPDSFFKIAVFEDARRAALQRTILQIKDHGKPFKNMYSAVSLRIRQRVFEDKNTVICHYNQQSYLREQAQFLGMPRCNINYWTRPEEMQRVAALMRQPYLILEGHALWGLGIVTGNNAKMCKRSRRKGLVPVYRGKDVLPGRLKAASFFLNPEDFPRYQQMAPQALFQAPEKLVYRFISNKLVFCCDTHQRYLLNSANMLVLDGDFPLAAKQLAEVLNSPLTNWLFQQLFHTHKVLRGDLEKLPILTDLSLHRSFDLLDFNG